MAVKNANKLDMIGGGPSDDRPFINAIFSMFFPDNDIKKLKDDGMKREEVLARFRNSDQHDIIKGNDVFKKDIRGMNFRIKKMSRTTMFVV